MYCSCKLSVQDIVSCSSEASLGCTAFAIKCTAYCHYLTAGATLGCTTAEDIIKLQEQHWGVLQEPHLGVLHLTSSGLHILSCKSGASHGVLYMPTGVLNMPSCTSEASLGCNTFAIKCTAEAII